MTGRIHVECAVADRPGTGMVHTKRALDEVGRDRLRREAEALAGLRHPDVVEVVVVDDDELVTRLAGRRTLADIGPHDAARVEGWIRAVRLVVDDLHAAGWTHGAIRAEHVVLGADGRVTLCSFRRAARHPADHEAFDDDRAALVDMETAVRTATGAPAPKPARSRRPRRVGPPPRPRSPRPADHPEGEAETPSVTIASATAIAAAVTTAALARFGGWRTGAPPTAAALAIAVLHGAATAAAAYLALTSIVVVAAGATRRVRWAAAAARALPTPVRRALVALSGAGLVSLALPRSGTAASPASSPGTATLVDGAGTGPATTVTTTTSTTTVLPTTPTTPTTPPTTPPTTTSPAPLPATAPAPIGSRTWTVAPGDHLWRIAEATTAERLGRPPTEREVARYWRRLVATNRSRLADRANPDLVFVGQTFELPD